MDQAQQQIQVCDSKLELAGKLFVLVLQLDQDRLDEHETNRQGCPELMRYRGCKTFKVLHLVLLSEYLRLQVQLLQVRDHILEVHCDRWLVEVVDLCGSQQAVIVFVEHFVAFVQALIQR